MSVKSEKVLKKLIQRLFITESVWTLGREKIVYLDDLLAVIEQVSKYYEEEE